MVYLFYFFVVIGVSASPSGGSAASTSNVHGPSQSVDLGQLSQMPGPSGMGTLSEATQKSNQTELLKGPNDLAQDVVERKAKGTLDEYLKNCCDVESTFEDICKSFHPKHMQDVAYTMILAVLEDKPTNMKKTGELLDKLVTKHALLPSQLEDALLSLLEETGDLEIDIPKLWENIGVILGTFF